MISTLNYFEKIGFVHGDLNKKNIVYTKKGFKIIDYEPSLFQLHDGLRQFMVTKPYISKLDLKEKNITIRTDKIGFYYFVLRINKLMKSRDVSELTKKWHHKRWLNISESRLKKTSYETLLNLAFDELS